MPVELTHIENLPPMVRGPLQDFAQRLLDVYGPKVRSIAVYGSAAGVNFHPKTSDINMVVVFDSLGFDVFEKSHAVMARARKYKISTPLFLTEDYIRNSSDVFPIEFSAIKNHHVLIFGADIFGSVSIDPQNMRLFCEAQIKGKLLRIRQAFMESGGGPEALQSILGESLNSLFPVFWELIAACGATPAIDKEKLLQQLAEKCSLDATSLLAIYRDRNTGTRRGSPDLREQLKDYLRQLERLSERIDQL